MGLALMWSACASCQKMMAYNPRWVPSVRINDVKEPICLRCVETANPIRIKKGLSPIEVNPQAYSPIPEEELG